MQAADAAEPAGVRIRQVKPIKAHARVFGRATLEECFDAFNAYYNNNSPYPFPGIPARPQEDESDEVRQQRAANMRRANALVKAKLFDIQRNRKDEFTIDLALDMNSAKYTKTAKGPKTFDVLGVDAFDDRANMPYDEYKSRYLVDNDRQPDEYQIRSFEKQFGSYIENGIPLNVEMTFERDGHTVDYRSHFRRQFRAREKALRNRTRVERAELKRSKDAGQVKSYKDGAWLRLMRDDFIDVRDEPKRPGQPVPEYTYYKDRRKQMDMEFKKYQKRMRQRMARVKVVVAGHGRDLRSYMQRIARAYADIVDLREKKYRREHEGNPLSNKRLRRLREKIDRHMLDVTTYYQEAMQYIHKYTAFKNHFVESQVKLMHQEERTTFETVQQILSKPEIERTDIKRITSILSKESVRLYTRYFPADAKTRTVNKNSMDYRYIKQMSRLYGKLADMLVETIMEFASLFSLTYMRLVDIEPTEEGKRHVISTDIKRLNTILLGLVQRRMREKIAHLVTRRQRQFAMIAAYDQVAMVVVKKLMQLSIDPMTDDLPKLPQRQPNYINDDVLHRADLQTARLIKLVTYITTPNGLINDLKVLFIVNTLAMSKNRHFELSESIRDAFDTATLPETDVEVDVGMEEDVDGDDAANNADDLGDLSDDELDALFGQGNEAIPNLKPIDADIAADVIPLPAPTGRAKKALRDATKRLLQLKRRTKELNLADVVAKSRGKTKSRRTQAGSGKSVSGRDFDSEFADRQERLFDKFLNGEDMEAEVSDEDEDNDNGNVNLENDGFNLEDILQNIEAGRYDDIDDNDNEDADSSDIDISDLLDQAAAPEQEPGPEPQNEIELEDLLQGMPLDVNQPEQEQPEPLPIPGFDIDFNQSKLYYILGDPGVDGDDAIDVDGSDVENAADPKRVPYRTVPAALEELVKELPGFDELMQLPEGRRISTMLSKMVRRTQFIRKTINIRLVALCIMNQYSLHRGKNPLYIIYLQSILDWLESVYRKRYSHVLTDIRDDDPDAAFIQADDEEDLNNPIPVRYPSREDELPPMAATPYDQHPESPRAAVVRQRLNEFFEKVAARYKKIPIRKLRGEENSVTRAAAYFAMYFKFFTEPFLALAASNVIASMINHGEKFLQAYLRINNSDYLKMAHNVLRDRQIRKQIDLKKLLNNRTNYRNVEESAYTSWLTFLQMNDLEARHNPLPLTKSPKYALLQNEDLPGLMRRYSTDMDRDEELEAGMGLIDDTTADRMNSALVGEALQTLYPKTTINKRKRRAAAQEEQLAAENGMNDDDILVNASYPPQVQQLQIDLHRAVTEAQLNDVYHAAVTQFNAARQEFKDLVEEDAPILDRMLNTKLRDSLVDFIGSIKKKRDAMHSLVEASDIENRIKAEDEKVTNLNAEKKKVADLLLLANASEDKRKYRKQLATIKKAIERHKRASRALALKYNKVLDERQELMSEPYNELVRISNDLPRSKRRKRTAVTAKGVDVGADLEKIDIAELTSLRDNVQAQFSAVTDEINVIHSNLAEQSQKIKELETRKLQSTTSEAEASRLDRALAVTQSNIMALHQRESALVLQRQMIQSSFNRYTSKVKEIIALSKKDISLDFDQLGLPTEDSSNTTNANTTVTAAQRASKDRQDRATAELADQLLNQPEMPGLPYNDLSVIEDQLRPLDDNADPAILPLTSVPEGHVAIIEPTAASSMILAIPETPKGTTAETVQRKTKSPGTLKTREALSQLVPSAATSNDAALLETSKSSAAEKVTVVTIEKAKRLYTDADFEKTSVNIGNGASGCVYRPLLKCKTRLPNSPDLFDDPKKMISKVVNMINFRQEMIDGRLRILIDKVDPRQRFLIHKQYLCNEVAEEQRGRIYREQRNECLRGQPPEDQKIRYIGYSDGGHTLYSWVDHYAKSIREVKQQHWPKDKLIHLLTFLLHTAKGLQLLHKNSLFHNDVKETNIVIGHELDGKEIHDARLIDLGLLVHDKGSISAPLYKNSYPNLTRTYYYWPPESGLIEGLVTRSQETRPDGSVDKFNERTSQSIKNYFGTSNPKIKEMLVTNMAKTISAIRGYFIPMVNSKLNTVSKLDPRKKPNVDQYIIAYATHFNQYLPYDSDRSHPALTRRLERIKEIASKEEHGKLRQYLFAHNDCWGLIVSAMSCIIRLGYRAFNDAIFLEKQIVIEAIDPISKDETRIIIEPGAGLLITLLQVIDINRETLLTADLLVNTFSMLLQLIKDRPIA